MSGVRTAIGRFGGALKDVEAADLGAACVKEAIERAALDPEEVEEVVMEQVAQVGRDAYKARRVSLGAGLSSSTTAMNVNRLGGSGFQAILTGAQSVMTGYKSSPRAGTSR